MIPVSKFGDGDERGGDRFLNEHVQEMRGWVIACGERGKIDEG
jgi:hypothetical protein